MGDNLYRVFGLLIGQVIPGFLLVLAVAPRSASVRTWLGTAAASDITLGSTAVLLLLSIAAGLVLSALRFLVFEQLGDVEHRAMLGRNDTQRLKAVRHVTYEQIQLQHYAYYQCYGSLALVLPLAALANASLWPSGGFGWGLLLLAAAIEYTLIVTAVDAYARMRVKRDALDQVVAGETAMSNGHDRPTRNEPQTPPLPPPPPPPTPPDRR